MKEKRQIKHQSYKGWAHLPIFKFNNDKDSFHLLNTKYVPAVVIGTSWILSEQTLKII